MKSNHHSNYTSQRSVFSNVGKRGYLDGWSMRKLFMRQLVKLVEESAEAFLAVEWPEEFSRLRDRVESVRYEAGRVFDDKSMWEKASITPDGKRAAMQEIIDAQVVICTAACAFEEETGETVHVIRAAELKSRVDIKLGVR